MAYLTQHDLQSAIRDRRLADILDNAQQDNLTDAFELALDESLGLVSEYLARFEVNEEFQKTGNKRNKTLVYHVKNICLYILYGRIDDEQIPPRIIKNYDDTLLRLREIEAGKASLSLPLIQVDPDGDGITEKKTLFLGGSENPRSPF